MPVEDLRSKAKLTTMHWAIDRWKKEYDNLEVEHSLISKYHERLWFQRMRRQTVEELLDRYRWLAYMLYSLESSINDYQEQIWAHHRAVEELHKSMDPFKGVDLSQHPLTQTSMF